MILLLGSQHRRRDAVLSPMTPVVVTGVAGFIGSHLAEALLRAELRVLGVDRRDPGPNLAHYLRHPGLRLVTADLNEAELGSLVSGARVVFHLAGLGGMRSSWGAEFAEYTRCNVLATQRLAQACVEERVPRLVVASSSSVYGDHEPGPRGENDLPKPASPYGVSKLAAEQLCLAYARHPRSATSVVALRLFTVFGPRQRDDMLIGRVLRAATLGTGLTIYGDGRQRRDFTYVDDVVDATIAAASAPSVAEVINVGTGRTTSVLDVLAIAGRLTGNPVRPVHLPAYEGDVMETHADNGKAARVLGWRPRVDVAAGMRDQLAWLMEREENR
jgi:UDP-glucuronate 4-epimerase